MNGHTGVSSVFFFNDTATTEIYTLSLHDALPIYAGNYTVTNPVTTTAIINKATAVVVVTPYTVTYDGNPHSATLTSSPAVNAETGATFGTDTLNTTHTAARTYSSDSWSCSGTANY